MVDNVSILAKEREAKQKELALENQQFSYDVITELTGYQNKMLAVIHKTVAKGTTNSEFTYFLIYCKSIGLNPLNKEIWCYKNTKGDVIIFTGRDGFLKKNKENPLYRGMRSSEVCEYDDFEIDMISGEVKHKITNNRGHVIGAYAIVSIEGQKDIIKWLDFAEFDLKQAKWTTAPKMMIKKCAESHTLKEAAGMTGIQAEEGFIVRNNVAYAEVEERPAEEERLELMIENAKTLDGLKKLMKECTTAELVELYDKKKKELENK